MTFDFLRSALKVYDARVFPQWRRNGNGTKGNATTHKEEHDFNQGNLNYCERSERPRPMISDQTYYISGRLSRLARDMFLEIARAHNFGREAEPVYSAASREGAQV